MRWRKQSLILAIITMACLPVVAQSYVTSATLEYSSDDAVGFFINGKTLVARTDYNPFDFGVFSTSDGTLPISIFNMNGDNTLAVNDILAAVKFGDITTGFLYHQDARRLVPGGETHIAKGVKTPGGDISQIKAGAAHTACGAARRPIQNNFFIQCQ